MSGAERLDPRHGFDVIDQSSFEWVLQHYRSLVASDGDEDLDELRYITIPDKLNVRHAEGDAHLTKADLITLVTWKLKHETFRPTLQALVKQNDAKTIEDASRKGFIQYQESGSKDALKTLSTLRGIGPATASLLLSVYDPDKAPFFSDELFRWAFFESSNGRGWDRRIKYTAKEYAELCEKISELLGRFNVRAVDAEKVAYTIGKGLLPVDARPAKTVNDNERGGSDPTPSALGPRMPQQAKRAQSKKRSAKNANGDLQTATEMDAPAATTSEGRSKRQRKLRSG